MYTYSIYIYIIYFNTCIIMYTYIAIYSRVCLRVISDVFSKPFLFEDSEGAPAQELHEAVWLGDPTAVKRLLAEGAAAGPKM